MEKWDIPVETIFNNKTDAKKALKKLNSLGFKAIIREDRNTFYIEIIRDRTEKDLWLPEDHIEDIAYFIRNPYFGAMDKDLGIVLMNGFIHSLLSNEFKPQYVIFLAEAVSLTVKNSPLVSWLIELENTGVNILVCRASLEYFELLNNLAVGRMVKFPEIITILSRVKKVITV